MSTSSSPPAAPRPTTLARALLVCLLASCAPAPAADPAVSGQIVEVHHASAAQSDCAVNRDTVRRVHATRPAAPRSRAERSARSAPAAQAVAVRRDEARQDTGTATRAGGATTSAEPKPSYYWDDCVMAGLAVSPHCGI